MATRLPVSLVPPGDINDVLERLRARAGALEQGISDIIHAIRDGALAVPRPSMAPGARPAPIKLPEKPRKWSDPMYARLAEPGVMTLEITALDKVHSLVSINGAAACPMPNVQADFLRAIAGPGAGPGGNSGDEFVPWKCKATTARERGSSLHAVDVMVGRLRDRLWSDFKVSPLLVESRAAHIRFRLRVAKPDAP